MGAPDRTCACPVCGGRARWSVMSTGRVCITHSDCGVQVFARGDEADELMRDRFISGNERNVTNVREPQPAETPVMNVQQGEGFDVWPT